MNTKLDNVMVKAVRVIACLIVIATFATHSFAAEGAQVQEQWINDSLYHFDGTSMQFTGTYRVPDPNNPSAYTQYTVSGGTPIYFVWTASWTPSGLMYWVTATVGQYVTGGWWTGISVSNPFAGLDANTQYILYQGAWWSIGSLQAQLAQQRTIGFSDPDLEALATAPNPALYVCNYSDTFTCGN
jgi:hypothetical protein